MQNLINETKDKWIRPWDEEKFDDLYNRDNRFFAIVIKGALGWLTRNIGMYGKPIKHFILTTGSSYLYVEQNGYNFKWSETTGEDIIYMQMPRCVVSMEDISVPFEELTSPFVRGTYERKSGTNIEGFNAEIRRLPLEISLSLNYVLSNFNESLILAQELLDKIIFQKYFDIIYLGETISCSLEFPQDFKIEMNKVDFQGLEVNQKTINIQLKLSTNYPVINERSEVNNKLVINTSNNNMELFNDKTENITDKQLKTIE